MGLFNFEDNLVVYGTYHNNRWYQYNASVNLYVSDVVGIDGSITSACL